MIRKVYDALVQHILMIFLLRRYGGIWGLKGHLQQHENPNRHFLACYDRYFSRMGSWISFNSQFAGPPCFPHGPYGIFVSGGAKVGKNAVIFQQVTIGSNTLNDSDKTGSPTLGDNVYIGAGAKIIGDIHIGDNCRIGANAVVYMDLPPHSVAVQSKTRIIQKENLDNRHYSQQNGKWVYYCDGEWIADKSKSI